MQYNTSSTRYLQDKTVNSNVTATVTGNYDEVTLKKGSNVTLTGTIFGKIKLEEGASVRFTSSTINRCRRVTDRERTEERRLQLYQICTEYECESE